MPELSPTALHVWDAFNNIVEGHGPPRLGIAAALRAANAQIPPLRYAADYIEHLLAIAAELEGQPLPQPTCQPLRRKK